MRAAIAAALLVASTLSCLAQSQSAAPARIEAVAQAASAAAPKALTSRGAWSATTNYVTDDLVTSRGSAWRAKRANKNKLPGQTLPTSTAMDWELFAAGFNAAGAWTASKFYHLNDLVTRDGTVWRAMRSSKGQTPVAGADWEQFAAKGAAGPAGPAGAAGAAGATGQTGPVGLTGATGPEGPSGSGPTGPAGATGAQGAKGLNWRTTGWSPATTAYVVDDAVGYAGKAYVAIQPSTSADPKNPALEPDYWSVLASGPNWRGNWASGQSYQPNDAVFHNGSSYGARLPNSNEDPAAGAGSWLLLAQKGDTGPTGANGTNGAPGANGATGATGSQGDTGAAGPTGPQGATGTLASEYGYVYSTSAQVVQPNNVLIFESQGSFSSFTSNLYYNISYFGGFRGGAYLITWHVNATCAGGTCAWGIFKLEGLNDVLIPGTQVSSSDRLIQGSAIVDLVPGNIITLINTGGTGAATATAAMTVVRIGP